MSRLADLILYLHWGWLGLMVVSPFILPWYVVSLMAGIVLAMNSFNDMKCPITQLEYRLRRDAQERKLCSFGMFCTVPPDVRHGDVLTSHRGKRYFVHQVERGRPAVYVSAYLPMRSAMERLLQKFGVYLSPQEVQYLTLAVLIGAPILAWLWR